MHVFTANTRAPPRTRRKKKQAPVAEQTVPCIYTARKDARGRAYPKEVLGIWATKLPSPDGAERLFTDVNRAGHEQPTDSRQQPSFLLRFLPLHLISSPPGPKSGRSTWTQACMARSAIARGYLPSRPRTEPTAASSSSAVLLTLHSNRVGRW